VVARWPHGCRRQCSEVAVPALVGSNLTEGGEFFSKEGTSAGPWMCMYVFQGLMVGWWKEERPGKVPRSSAAHKEKREEKQADRKEW
jgi:hypothetical protein